jgi:putative oxidoreductase
MGLLARVCPTSAPAAVVLIRLVVGGVFLCEGIQKFLFASELGSGRFKKIGIPSPEFFGPFVGGFEIACGVLLLLGLLTRIAALPMIVVMVVAIATTKLPILQSRGFWFAAHEARTDYAMLLCLLFLTIVGAGRLSVDARLSTRPGA